MSFFVVSRGYLQVFPDRLRLQVPAESLVIEKCGAFSSPQQLLADMSLAESLLREAIQDAYAAWADPRPWLLIHPKEVPGGRQLSEHDRRQVLLLGRSAGARHCALWTGPEDPTAEDMVRMVPTGH